MATVQNIITRALRRSGITRVGESPQARLSIESLDILNDMLYGLQNEGIDMRLEETRTAEFTLTDTFYFWIPLADVLQRSINKFSYQGTWDANANSPALSSGSGTDGYVYRVATAGSTTLDDVTSWAENDFLIFGEPKYDSGKTDRAWFRSQRSRPWENGISAMLAVRLSEELGHDLAEHMVYTAKKARNALFNAFSKPAEKNIFDTGIVYTPTWARFNTDEAI